MKWKYTQLPVIGIWWLKRRLRYFFWSCYNRFSIPAKFESVGKGVKFNGKVRVEHPFSKIRIGDNCMIGIGCYFLSASEAPISIGNTTSINDHCYITACHGIEIGNNVSIAEQVSIRDFDHEFADVNKPIREQGFRGAPIKIGDDVWIGRGVMITAGITIGKGCIIGANAVVTKDIPDWSIAAGVPAKVIKTRLAVSEKKINPELELTGYSV
jgi:acetyltransferase-like isoleucine patch superfamily enzyme